MVLPEGVLVDVGAGVSVFEAVVLVDGDDFTVVPLRYATTIPMVAATIISRPPISTVLRLRFGCGSLGAAGGMA